jgi:hypothetical protein
MKGEHGLVTLSEVVYYLMPVSLMGPLDSDYTDIFVWLVKQVKKDTKVSESDTWFHEAKLTEWQQKLLFDLRKRLYSASVKGYNEQLRVERRAQRTQAKTQVQELPYVDTTLSDFLESG